MARILYEFPHSHFCEKARWAIDWKRLAYRRQSLLPPSHVFTTRRYGKRTYVPLFLDEQKAVQGSSEIIDYLDQTYPERPLTSGDPGAAKTLEKRLDKSLGVPLRVFFYHHGLQYKEFVCDAFLQNSGAMASFAFRLIYPGVSKLIRSSYSINARTAEQAESDVFRELDRLWKEKTSPYFNGDEFGRIDITIASLLAPIPRPQEHPMRWAEAPDNEALRKFEKQASEHPLIQWVSEVYGKHRVIT